MADFQFLQNPVSKKWVILSPKRAFRPDASAGVEPICPFCLGREKNDEELFRIGGKSKDEHWHIRVVPNKYPFAPIHEVIIHSPDHHKNFSELPLSQVELIIETYHARFKEHADSGQVIIFNNHGEIGGESLPHPHTQLAVVPKNVSLDIPQLDEITDKQLENAVETEHFAILSPKTEEWPYEVCIAPKRRGRSFGQLEKDEIKNLAYVLQKVLKGYEEEFGFEFPFNFFIYPGGDWYLRLMPRLKSLGGFELATGIYVNTKESKESNAVLRKIFS